MSEKDLSNIIEEDKTFLGFSSNIENQIISDKFFKKFMNIIEDGLKEFITLKNLKTTFKFYFKKDWEIPNQKNLILSLDLEEISKTQEKIDKWNEISLFIGDKIDELIENSSSEDKELFRNLDYRFYIKVEPL